MHPLHSLGLCGFFIASSTWCTLYNKYILKDVLPSSNLLLLAQNLLTIILLLLGQLLGLIQCKTITLSPHTLLGQENVKNDALIGVMYALNVITGLWSLKFLTIPVFGALKRSTVIIVWLGEACAPQPDLINGSVPRAKSCAVPPPPIARKTSGQKNSTCCSHNFWNFTVVLARGGAEIPPPPPV